MAREINKKQEALRLYLTLSGVFIALLITCNLVFNKFITWNPFGIYEFHISVGLIPYPLTFLVTDIISEIYGSKRANDVVKVGLFTSIIVLVLVGIGDSATAIEGSYVDDETYTRVFGFAKIAVGASMMAYLFAQFIDIKIFHFIKTKTEGRHLWLRNNLSTISSQLLDTLTVLFLLCFFKALPWELFWELFISGFIFKIIVAALDTPIIYLIVSLIKKRYHLGAMDELKLD